MNNANLKSIDKRKKHSSINRMCFKYTVCAVLFGTDNTILNVSLKDGFVFVRRSLIPAIDCLDAVFDTGTMGLRRDYETARIDKDNLDVICIEKHKKVYLEKATSRDWFERQVDDDLVKMDNIIRSIRLFYECPIRYKKISYKMESVDTQSGSIFYSSIIPISESSSTKEISKFHCDPDEIPVLSEIRHDVRRRSCSPEAHYALPAVFCLQGADKTP